jgi:uncharacterized protein (TIGR03437 family)
MYRGAFHLRLVKSAHQFALFTLGASIALAQPGELRISNFYPSVLTTSGDAQLLWLEGGPFVPGTGPESTRIFINGRRAGGAAETTTRIRADVSWLLGAKPQELQVQVQNLDGGASNFVTVPVVNSAPVLSMLSADYGRDGLPTEIRIESGEAGAGADTKIYIDGVLTAMRQTTGLGPYTYPVPEERRRLFGAVQFQVKTPEPGGGVSQKLNFATTPIRSVTDFALSGATDSIYFSVDYRANEGNRLYIADPENGQITGQMLEGLAPARLALEQSGERLYATLPFLSAIALVDLRSKEVIRRIPLEYLPYSATPVPLDAVPVDDVADRLLVALDQVGFAVYDGTRRLPATILGAPRGPIVRTAEPNRFYIWRDTLDLVLVNSDGVHVEHSMKWPVAEPGSFAVWNGRGYFFHGEVIDLATGSQIGTLRGRGVPTLRLEHGQVVYPRVLSLEEESRPLGIGASAFDLLTLDEKLRASVDFKEWIFQGGRTLWMEGRGIFSLASVGGGLWKVRQDTFEVIPEVEISGCFQVTTQLSCSSVGGLEHHTPSPGALLRLTGRGLGPETPVQADTRNSVDLPTELDGTSVIIGGLRAPVLSISDREVITVVPYGLAARTRAVIEIERLGQRHPGYVAPMTNSLPGAFTSDGSGQGRLAAINEDGTVNTAENPARAGSILTIFISGGGLYDKPVVTGPLPPADLPRLRVLPLVQVGGLEAEVVYAGGAPSLLTAVSQVNLRVPTNVTSGDRVPVRVSWRDVEDRTFVSIR